MENDFLFFGYVDEEEDDDINLKKSGRQSVEILAKYFFKIKIAVSAFVGE